MMAKGNFVGKCAAAVVAIALGWIFTPQPRYGLVYAIAPDNAQVLLDYRNKTWLSPPCLLTDHIERSSGKLIDDWLQERDELGDRPHKAGEVVEARISIRELINVGVFEEATMAEALALQKKDLKWHPDDVCNAAGGFWEEKTVWGWITNRPSRWTPDGQWRW